MNVTAVIINYQTPELTQRAIASLRSYYPQLPLLLIDNGSRDSSGELLDAYAAVHSPTTVFLRNSSNLYHGPAMHQAAEHCRTDYLLYLDSDCHVTKGGFLELMLDVAEKDGSCYAVGKRVYMNDRGFEVGPGPFAIAYIRPSCMLVNKRMYLTLPPFTHHGTPCLDNMRAAASSGYALVDFPILSYVVHEGRGTASRYGYGLGLKGKINHLLNKLGL